MGEIGGFLRVHRVGFDKRDASTRTGDYEHYFETQPDAELREQGARCMDCGVPFCHLGCPLGNLIPDWNDLVYRNDWRRAIDFLHSTNNFPEFTGRVCPAPCEEACVLGIIEPPVTIKNIEVSIVEEAFKAGWVIADAAFHAVMDKSVPADDSGPLPTWLVTPSSDVPVTNLVEFPSDYQSQFKKLWQVG